MSLQEYLTEMLYTADKIVSPYFKGYAEIFKNPTRKEVLEIMQAAQMDGVRFGVDRLGNIFAWDDSILHADMSRRLKKDWVVMLQYTMGSPTLYLSSGSDKKDWEKAGGDDLVDRFNRMLPMIHSIEMQTRPFSVLWGMED